MSDSELPPVSDPLAVDSGATAPGATTVVPGLGPSWQEQDGTLRDLWMQNKTPQEISEALNRSVAAIMTRAARLGLPRRSAPGRKPGTRRMGGQDQNGQAERVSVARAYAPATPPGGETQPQASTRICLMCLRQFRSMGRHNRICSSCKSSSEYESAVATSDIHLPV